ncbi:polysaccharide export outer membrane protein [Cognatiyoonia koreensis]|uniref:Polysaccharide export outer membrane protein n=1 Tax=Cognatiyoonia koreensis TaxID=364200 RepID=A0A1I0RLZ6_9RHOB|nr:polysaccharide biosynthesis/export family protein [Cognatiyoonia koreensis]SEW41955.1 polysaccharide export outer membrane protein [Cognatiyoonia koreensis]
MRILVVAALALGLAGCGTVYRTSDVIAGETGATKVRVVPMTAETVIQANRSPFQPQTLPAVFSLTAGSGSGLRGAGALPEPPSIPENRPNNLELRLPPAIDPGPYEVGIGDVVLLSTPSSGSTVEELSGLLAAQNARQGYTVQDDGSINIPNVGRVRIAGLTIEDAEAELFQRLVENQIDPTFSLEIAEFNSRRVSIGGAVANPTVVPVSLTPLYLEEALAAAGGITVQDQDFASIRLYREGTLYQIPLNQLFSQAGLTRTRLLPGDAVFVDTEFELDRAQDYFQQQILLVETRQRARTTALQELQLEVNLRRADLDEARQNFRDRIDLGADNRDYVYLAGEVGTQSRFALPFESRATLADALFDAGNGIDTATGDVSQIYVLRGSKDPREFGAVTAWHLDGRSAGNFALLPAFELRPDDIIFIAQQPVTRWDRAVSQIVPTLVSVGNQL